MSAPRRKRVDLVLVGLMLAAGGPLQAALGWYSGPSKEERLERALVGACTFIGLVLAAIGAWRWWRARGASAPEPGRMPPASRQAVAPLPVAEVVLPELATRWSVAGVARALWPWLWTAVIAGVAGLFLWRYLQHQRGAEPIVWKSARALVLAGGALLVGAIAFHLQRRRSAAMAFSQVGLVGARGAGAWLGDLPAVLRVVAVAALAVGLARPETYRTVKHEVDTIDIMIVVDMSKSMEETDMQRDRLDAAQRVIRKFLRRTANDRVGLVIFGQQAMLACPLTQDTKLLEQIVSDLAIGDVPELGTAIGDGLALGLAQLRRSDAKSKVVILLSDGDTNWVTRFDPDEAARAAKQMGVKVYTLLVGSESSDLFGGMSVNPATLRSIAEITGGEYFRASDYDSFDRGFQTVRNKLDKTKRSVTERLPDKELFVPFALFALLLILFERLLASTRLRRLP